MHPTASTARRVRAYFMKPRYPNFRRTMTVMQRTDMLDVSPEMRRLIIKLTREKGPEWRVRKALEMSVSFKKMKKHAMVSLERQRCESD